MTAVTCEVFDITERKKFKKEKKITIKVKSRELMKLKEERLQKRKQ